MAFSGELPSLLLFDCRHCYFMAVFGVEALDELGSAKHKASTMRSAHVGVAISKDAEIFGARHYRKYDLGTTLVPYF
jgi:hypothetical protein